MALQNYAFSDPRRTQSCIRQVNIKRHSSFRMLSVGHQQKEKTKWVTHDQTTDNKPFRLLGIGKIEKKKSLH